MKTNQKGFGVLPVIVAVLVLGVAGFAGWSVWQKSKKAANSQAANVSKQSSDDVKSTDNENAKTVEFKTLTINGHMISYPLNDNNKKVIIESVNEFTDVSYKPVRDYFATQTNASEVCKGWKAGRLWAGTLADSPGLGETLEAKRQKMTAQINAGKAAKLDDDLYVTAPYKQNEGCTETYESNDAALKAALAEADRIEATWLKSMVNLK